jgi:hypothetical protein
VTIAVHHRPMRGRVHRTWPLSGLLFVAGVFLAFAALTWFAVRVAEYAHTVDVLTEERDRAVTTAEVANARLVEVGADPVPVPTTSGGTSTR